jgi:hypothetical protein
MGRVYLHIGAPKTGTTYLQDVLWSNQAALSRRGVLCWGHGPSAHFHAAQDLRGRYFRGHQDPRVRGTWERLARAARQWSGHTVLISHEILAGCDADEAQRAVDSLRPHEVHVLYTARDLGRQIPAMWQESVKNGRVMPYRAYLRTLQSERPELVGRIFWRHQDVPQVLQRWGAAVPAERIHVVTVPPPAAEAGLLWQRFCAATGLDPQGLDATGASGGDNISLGLAEAELLRRLNQRLKGQLSWPEHEALLKRFLARDVLTPRAGTARTGVPEKDRGWVTERSRAHVEALRDGGYDVVGSLSDLVPDFADHPDTRPDPGAGDVLDSAVDALAVLLTEHVGPRHRVPARLRRLAGTARARLPALPTPPRRR